jgi:DNA-binding PucR family transcriptional regulator
MSLSELQALVDHLAESLETSVLLESAANRMIVYSGPEHTADAVRRTAILRRQVPSVISEYNRAAGVYRSAKPVRIRMPDDLLPGHLERVAIPARFHDQLMGMLWVIDPARRLRGQRLADAVRTAEGLGLLLYEESLAQRVKSGVLAHLLSPVSELRASAVVELADEGFRTDDTVVVGVLQPVDVDEAVVAGALVEGLDEARLRLPVRHVRSLARNDHVVVLVRVGADDSDRAVTGPLEIVRHAILSALPSGIDQPRVIAAMGDPQERLISAATSYQQARLAARIARAMPSLGDSCEWATLGAFRALARLDSTGTEYEAVDPRLTPLLEERHASLLETLETFLDLAGDVKETAAHLHLHRGTLYYRLGRVSKVTGLDLSNGLDRLAAHIGIKIARLWNRLPPAAAVSSRHPPAIGADDRDGLAR